MREFCYRGSGLRTGNLSRLKGDKNVGSGVSYGWSVQQERIHWFGKRFWERGQAEDLHWLQPTR
jgi:hypothetical protein